MTATIRWGALVLSALFCLSLALPLDAQTRSRQRRRAPVAEQPPKPPPPSPPATSDNRPYDEKLLRLVEIMGSIHYLRELCGANEGQLWRDEMKKLLKLEGNTAIRRAKLVNAFNRGYRGFRRTYRSCTTPAKVAIDRFLEEGAQISKAILAESQ